MYNAGKKLLSNALNVKKEKDKPSRCPISVVGYFGISVGCVLSLAKAVGEL
jgi:hypothetical protein